MVLKLRFGLDDGRARTLEEVGKEFKVTRERIRQIEAKALRKLRHPEPFEKAEGFHRLMHGKEHITGLAPDNVLPSSLANVIELCRYRL